MKSIHKAGLAALFVLAALPVPGRAFEKPHVNLIFDVNPGNMMMSKKVDGLQVSKVIGTTRFIDETSGDFGWAPTMKVGAGLDTKDLYLDFTLGLGGILNTASVGSLILGDVAFRYKLSDKFTVGPHMSLIKYYPTWTGGYSDSDDLEFKDGKGAIYGISATLGRTVSFVGSVDYLSMSPLTITTKNGWSANRSSVDVSGWMVQLGVAFRFFRAK